MRPHSPTFEVHGNPDSAGSYVFTCEHASNNIPAYLVANETDATLLDDHWGWDIGAADVVGGLLAELGGQAVLGTFSRLVVDLNRDPKSRDLFLTEADGKTISFNRDLDATEREARIDRFFSPFHEAIEDVLATRKAVAEPPPTLLSVHSFTEMYRGEKRELEVGVLFDEHDEMAERLANAISAEGFRCALNQPYSGKPPNGLIYSAGSHGRSQGVAYIELEIRQDLISTTEAARAVASRLVGPLRALTSSVS